MFSNDTFNNVNWNVLFANESCDVRSVILFLYQINKLVNKHVSIKTVSKRRAKLLSKPWIIKGLRISVKIIFLTCEVLREYWTLSGDCTTKQLQFLLRTVYGFGSNRVENYLFSTAAPEPGYPEVLLKTLHNLAGLTPVIA